MKAQVQYTDAEATAIESMAENTAADYQNAVRVSKLMQRGIPSWDAGTEEGMKEWVVRFKWEYPWAVEFVPIPPDAPQRQWFEDMPTVTELMKDMANDNMETDLDKDTTLKQVATQGTVKRRRYSEDQIKAMALTPEELKELPVMSIGTDGTLGHEWGGKWYTEEYWKGWMLERKQKKARKEMVEEDSTEKQPVQKPNETGPTGGASASSREGSSAAQVLQQALRGAGDSHRGPGAEARKSREREGPYTSALGSGLRGAQSD